MTKEEQFWNWFKKNEAQFFFLNQIDDGDEKERILDELLAQLHIYCHKLYFEVGGEPDQKQNLIITAEGNQDYFDQVESLVKKAPHLEHWNVIAFKPIAEDGIIEINDIKLSPESMWFMPLNSKNSEKIGLRIYIDNFNPADTETYLKAIFLVLDNLLGEKSNALDIGYVEIDDLATYPQKEDLIELTKLARYISWNKNRSAN